MKYTIDLPWPPSANRLWRTTRQGRMYKTQEAADYGMGVGWIVMEHGINPMTGPVCLSLQFYRPMQRGDLDNRIKAVLDALNGVLYKDDKQVVELHAFLADDKHNPRVEVTIWERNK